MQPANCIMYADKHQLDSASQSSLVKQELATARLIFYLGKLQKLLNSSYGAEIRFKNARLSSIHCAFSSNFILSVITSYLSQSFLIFMSKSCRLCITPLLRIWPSSEVYQHHFLSEEPHGKPVTEVESNEATD